nr:SWIM zinc finger family protein [Haloferax sp. AS1]
MDIRFGDVGPIYQVDSPSGKSYEVDVEAGTCSCPDHRKRGVECKHLRRVLFEIRTRVLPKPTGRFATCEQETRRLRNSN